jgi:proteasome lid subunit RPN8/RPN11
MMSGEAQNPEDFDQDDCLAGPEQRHGVFMPEELYSELIRVCLDALPDKAYGLIGGPDLYHPSSLYPCASNLRNTPEWKSVFDSFGDFHRNPDLGFVIDPAEVKAVMDRMASRRELLVGVFHSHRYLQAVPSIADIGLNSGSQLFSYIVSVANPPAAEFGVFCLSEQNKYQRIPVIRR